MAQYVKQANIFGRIGSGIGQGLAEQLPKEIERGRLAQGLQQLEQQSADLTPQQYFTRALQVPGLAERPQVVQTLGELAKTQGTRANIRKAVQQGVQQAAQQGQGSVPRSINEVQVANLPQNRMQPVVSPSQQVPQGNFPEGQPQIVEENPLNPKFQERLRWTPQEKIEDINRTWDMHPNLSYPEIKAISDENEARYLSQPETYRKQQKDLEDIQEKVNTEIEKQLRMKLQVPEGQQLWDKLSGESQNRIQRGVANDLRKNPKANVNDLVNRWTDRALLNDKNKKQLEALANRDFIERNFKKGENYDKLKSYSKPFRDFGNSEEYYNILRSKPFLLTPEGAASISHELSPTAKGYISKITSSPANSYYENTLKYAADLPDYLTRSDSILSIAKHIKDKDPSFDIKAFLSEVRRRQDEIGLTGEQALQLNAPGIDEVFPNWGDFFLFPKLGKGV